MLSDERGLRGVARGQSKYMEESDNKGTLAIFIESDRTCMTDPGYASVINMQDHQLAVVINVKEHIICS